MHRKFIAIIRLIYLLYEMKSFQMETAQITNYYQLKFISITFQYSMWAPTINKCLNLCELVQHNIYKDTQCVVAHTHTHNKRKEQTKTTDKTHLLYYTKEDPNRIEKINLNDK